MKLYLMAFVLMIATSVYAQGDSQKCYGVKNTLDRKYCLDKYLESVKDKLASEKSTWSNGLAPASKAAKIADLQASINAKKDQLGLVSNELSLEEKQLQDLTGVAEVVAAAPKKKEKKKHKLPFGIKL